jgi:hypothetical protein
MEEWRCIITSWIRNLVSRWRIVVRFTPRPLYPQRKVPRFPLHMRLCESQRQSWRCGEEKNLFPLSGIETRFLGRPDHTLVATPSGAVLVFHFLNTKIPVLLCFDFVFDRILCPGTGNRIVALAVRSHGNTMARTGEHLQPVKLNSVVGIIKFSNFVHRPVF